MIDIKLFDAWNIVKKRLERRVAVRFFREGQVWWCSIGQNIGSEAYGKGRVFVRPVLIFRKISHNLFLGVPVTTKTKSGDWYSTIKFKGKGQAAMLYQIKVMDRKRLSNKIGEISEKEFGRISKDLACLLFGGKYSPRLTAGIDGLPQK